MREYDKGIYFKATDELDAAIKDVARRQFMTKSQYVRTAIIRALGVVPIPPRAA